MNLLEKSVKQEKKRETETKKKHSKTNFVGGVEIKNTSSPPSPSGGVTDKKEEMSIYSTQEKETQKGRKKRPC